MSALFSCRTPNSTNTLRSTRSAEVWSQGLSHITAKFWCSKQQPLVPKGLWYLPLRDLPTQFSFLTAAGNLCWFANRPLSMDSTERCWFPLPFCKAQALKESAGLALAAVTMGFKKKKKFKYALLQQVQKACCCSHSIRVQPLFEWNDWELQGEHDWI